MIEAERIHNGAKAASAPLKTSLQEIFKAYESGYHFNQLKASTQADYREIYKFTSRFKGAGGIDLASLTTASISRLRDKIATESTADRANRVLKLLSVLYAWGVEDGKLERNPVKDVRRLKKPRGTKDLHKPWTEEEKRAVIRSAPLHILAPILLMMCTGLAPADTLRLRKSRVVDGRLTKYREKTGGYTTFKIPEQILKIILSIKGNETGYVFVNSFGQPWTDDGFRSSWHDFREKLRGEGFATNATLYGLRHTVATALKDAGQSDEEISIALGQRGTGATKIYTKRATNRRVMEKNESLINGIMQDLLDKCFSNFSQ